MTESICLKDLAAWLGREIEGDATVVLRGVASLEEAGEGDLVFVRSERFLEAARSSRASAFILPPGLDAGGRPAIRSPDPGFDFARSAERLNPALSPEPGIHATADVDDEAAVASTASVGPRVSIGRGCRVGEGTQLHANVVLYPGVEVGDGCRIEAGAVLREGTRVGNRVILHSGAVIGAEGFGYVRDEGGRYSAAPQVGRVVLEDDVEVGANSTIDRGTLHETRVRRGAKIDNLVHVGHNCDIGENVVIAAQVGLSGSTVVGRDAILMGQVGSAGHLEIGEGAFVGAKTGLHRDVKAGSRVFGYPQREEWAWQRTTAALSRLPGLLQRVRDLERKLGLRAASRGREPGDE